MSQAAGKGSILIKDSADLPEVLRMESVPYSKGWRIFTKLDRHGLDRCVSQAAWNLFFMSGAITASAIGREGEKTTHRAIMNLTKNPELRAYNCLEIARVSDRSFLRVPYVNVAANVCHIQESASLARTPKVAGSRATYASS